MCRRPGVSLLADDVATLQVDGEDAQVIPTEASVWLESNESDIKKPCTVPRSAAEAVPLRLIVDLAFGEQMSGLRTRELRGAEAVSALLRPMMRFKLEGEREGELQLLQRLMARARTIRVERSRDVPAETVANRLLDLLAEQRS
jgi:hypothetical protein